MKTENIIDPDIVSKKGISTPAIVMLALAVISFALLTGIDDKTTSLPVMLMTAGGILGAVGLIMLLAGKRTLVHAPTGSKVRARVLTFEAEELDKLQKAMETRQFTQLGRLRQQDSGGVRLDMLLTADNRYALVSLYKYVPFDYELVGEPVKFHDEDAASFAAAMAQGGA